MADWNLRLKENQPGKFFVDSSCIGCEACVIQGPQFFKMLNVKIDAPSSKKKAVVEISAEAAKTILGKAVLYSQPTTESAIDEIRDIMLICPTNSIGEKE